MVHVIGMKQSTCTQRVLTVLAEKGVTDYTMFVPDFMKGALKQPDHLAKQPFGQIPILEDGDLRIFESRAICRYLAAKYKDQGSKLVPEAADLKATALFEQWASVEKDDFDVYASNIVDQKLIRVMKGLPTVTALVDEFTAELKAKLAVFNEILGKQKYMAGDEFSLVDIFYLPYMAMLYQVGLGELIDEQPNVKAWWERVSTRESWKEVTAAEI